MFLHKTLPLWPLPLIAVGVVGVLHPLVTLGAIILALAPVITKIKQPTRPTILAAPLGLFVISLLIGLWAAYDPALSLPMVFTMLGSILWFFSIIYADRTSARTTAQGLVVFAGLIAGYFVTQYAHIGYQTETGFMANVARTTSAIMPEMVFFAPHPNAVAGLLGSVLLLSVILIVQADKPAVRVGWGIVTVVMSYALLVTGSRGVWAALAVAGMLWAVLYLPGSVQRFVWLGLGTMIGIIAGLFALVTIAPARLTGNDFFGNVVGPVIATGVSRSTLYQNSLHLFWDYPYSGIGPGDTFAMVYSRFQLLIDVPYLEYAHNLYLAVALGQGILGLLALFWLMARFYGFVIGVEQTQQATNNATFFQAAWLGVTTIFIHGFTDAVQYSEARWTTPVLFALLGLTIAFGQSRRISSAAGEPVEAKATKLSPKVKWSILATIVITTVAIAGFWRPLTSAAYANLGTIYHTQAVLLPYLTDEAQEELRAEAKLYFERSLTVSPDNRVAQRRLGIMALNDEAFVEAVAHLEQAYAQEPDNQATLKALGYAYLWSGQLDMATDLLKQVDFRQRLIQELEYWQWQWGVREKPQLANNTNKILEQLRQ